MSLLIQINSIDVQYSKKLQKWSQSWPSDFLQMMHVSKAKTNSGWAQTGTSQSNLAPANQRRQTGDETANKKTDALVGS